MIAHVWNINTASKRTVKLLQLQRTEHAHQQKHDTFIVTAIIFARLYCYQNGVVQTELLSGKEK